MVMLRLAHTVPVCRTLHLRLYDNPVITAITQSRRHFSAPYDLHSHDEPTWLQTNSEQRADRL